MLASGTGRATKSKKPVRAEGSQLAFWERMEGGNGKSDGERRLRSEQEKAARGMTCPHTNGVQELELHSHGTEEMPESSRDKTAPSEPESGGWASGAGVSPELVPEHMLSVGSEAPEAGAGTGRRS